MSYLSVMSHRAFSALACAGKFKLCEVGKQESGDGGLTGPLAQVVFSDIDFDSELDTDEV